MKIKNKQSLILIGVVAAFLLPSLLLLFVAFSHPTKQTIPPNGGNYLQPTHMQTAIPSVISSLPANTNTGNPNVVSSLPGNFDANTSAGGPIAITFARPVDQTNLHVTSNQSIPFTVNTQGNSITITPQSRLTPATVYSFIIRYDPNLPAYLYAFRTAGASAGDTFDFADLRGDMDAIQHAPDVYLSNKTPYTGSDFTVRPDVSQNNGGFTFIVTLTGSDKTKAKQDFLDWVKTLGLTDQQIQSLNISYQ